MTVARYAFAVCSLACWASCGGAVDHDQPTDGLDATADTSCVSAASNCGQPDSGAPSITDAGDAGEAAFVDATGDGDGAVDDGGSEASDAGDAQIDGPGDGGVCAPIDGSVGTCDPVTQCGCAGNQTCGLGQWLDDAGVPHTTCRAYGNTAPGEHCLKDEDCGKGYECGAAGACRKYCAVDSDCVGVDPYRKCLHKSYFVGPLTKPPVEAPLGSCIPLCDPANPQNGADGFSPCGAGFQCQPFTKQGIVICQTICSLWSNKARLTVGQSCSLDFDCDPGLACAPADAATEDAGDAAATVCRRWCHVEGNDCGGSECIGTGTYAGSIKLGLCAL